MIEIWTICDAKVPKRTPGGLMEHELAELTEFLDSEIEKENAARGA